MESVFEQLKRGKDELSFGFSEAMATAGVEDLKTAFNRMNSDAG